jgi:predicted ATPase/DNA-binding CsgD family transcriptional regulator
MARRHNLPPQPTSLFGRRAESEATAALLGRAETRMVTITGTAGTGKTRLAIAVAERLVESFADGVGFVDLAAVTDPELVLPTVAQTLGLRDRSSRSPLDLLKRHLRDQRALLLLDNFEQVLAAAGRLGDLLAACPGLKLLMTSRAPLHLRWERELPLAPLPLPDPRADGPADELAAQPAVALFVDRARAARPNLALDDAEVRAIAELCVRLDGLPLAIELAAARIKVLPPRALLARIEDRLQLLGGGAVDVPARQQTLRGALDWSYGLLSPTEQALFRRLSVFAGGCTLEDAEGVCAGDAVLDGLASLVDKSLLRQEAVGSEARFAMLDTLRGYAREHLEASGEADALRRRHAERYLALAEAAAPRLHGPRQEEWLARLEAEHDNLRQALRYAIEGGAAETGLRLVEALWWFWLVRGRLTEGRAHLARLLAMPSAADPAELRAKALYAAGTLALYQSDYDAARARFAESVALRRSLGDSAGLAGALMSLGAAASQQGDLAAARGHFEEALSLQRALGDGLGTVQAIQNLANLLHESADLAGARRLCEEGIVLARELGWDRGLAVALHNLGNVAQDQSDLAAAGGCYEESLAVKRRLGDRRSMVVTLVNLATVRSAEGDGRQGHRLLTEALQIERSLGDKAGVAFVLERFAAEAAGRGRHARALRLAGAAAALREEVDAPLAQPIRLEARLAPARRALGDAAEAEWSAGRAMGVEAAAAEALADEPTPSQPAAADSPLSPREREVAGLVARGLTNRQIAERLVIAERTADGHVASILNKLGLSTRSQVAVWVVERGLSHDGRVGSGR